MSRPAIEAVGIGKQYQLGLGSSTRGRGRHNTLSETLYRKFRRSRRTVDSSAEEDTTDFWALRDVSFTAEAGEVFGVVGRNGSGKSTLLKILSRITEPTTGHADVTGRVGSLLEVGTGFHPQLTGRENIFLNGAVLGMTQAEVKRKFDEIVDFSEVERFLDTPVKSYSSGMYTRLAFAVAAHLDTEILIVDEVLAVGDAEFQRKCIEKMQSVADSDGRTVLFVSHNMAAVSQLTQRCILLQKGQVAYVGSTASAIESYLASEGNLTTTRYDVRNAPRKGSRQAPVQLTELSFERPVAHFAPDEDLSVVVSAQSSRKAEDIHFNLSILTAEGIAVGHSCGIQRFSFGASETRTVRIALPAPRLAPGRYYCGVALGTISPAGAWQEMDAVADTLHFEVLPIQARGDEAPVLWKRNWGNIAFPRQETELKTS